MKLKATNGWQFVLADAWGRVMAQVAGNVTMTFRRNLWHEAEVLLDIDDPRAADVMAAYLTAPVVGAPGTGAGGYPLLYGVRSNSPRFSGMLWSAEENADDAEGVVKLTFRSPFGFLMDAPLMSPLAYASTARAGDIAVGLLNRYESGLAGNKHRYGIGLPIPPTLLGATGAREYQAGQSIGQALVDLSVTGGVDFWDTPTWGVSGNSWPGGGSSGGASTSQVNQIANFSLTASVPDKSATVRFEYGPETLANCRKARRLTMPPRPAVLGIGADGLTVTQRDSVAQTVYGGSTMAAYSYPDETTTGGLGGRVAANIRNRPIPVVEITPDPDLAPDPWTDYFLGDKVTVTVSRGSLQVSTTPRVNALTIRVNEEGYEEEHVVAFDQGVTS